MKADLAIYSLVVGMSGLWVNVATMLNNKLDFYCCDNSVGFCKSGHKWSFKYILLHSQDAQSCEVESSICPLC